MTRENHVTLSALNKRIKEALKLSFPENVWVVAEIAQLQENISGHCYLDLVEKDATTDRIIARNKGTIWAYTYRMLKPYFETTTRQVFSSGLKVLVNVGVEYHEQYGLSLTIRDIDPAYTVGEMALKRQQTILQLQEEGVFEMNKELELPTLPQKLAIISSSTAAGYGDFMDQLMNNQEGIKFYTCLFQATMQGENAPQSIMEALNHIDENLELFDAVVIIRGGGASMDLSCFDDFNLCYFASQFPLPIITGIGHERDESVLDMVAHTSVKTPTAVAEFLVDCISRELAYVNDLQENIISSVQQQSEKASLRLELLAQKFPVLARQYIIRHENRIQRIEENLEASPQRFLRDKKQHLSKLQDRFAGEAPLLLQSHRNKLLFLKERMGRSTKNLLASKKQQMRHFEEITNVLNPQNVLKKGYSITTKNGKAIFSASDLHEGDILHTEFYNGGIASIVKTKNDENEKN